METTYKFTAYNAEAIYGYGSQAEADSYLAWLNKDREINHYEMEVADLTDEETEDLAFNLREELKELSIN